ncbi:MAG: tRNA epoxyqueuosine(34) reductase QueG [Ilumatobacteraceae bacterium]
MRRADRVPPTIDAAYVDALAGLTTAYGISHTGVASAAVLEGARAAIQHRIANELTDGMQFTFKNPQRSTDPAAAVRGARSVFVAARPYLLPAPERPSGAQARVGRYAWVDHYAPLREALWAVARRLRADGFKAVPFADDNSIVDRDVAHRAGIGWYGKNANLLLPGAGSWFVLGCVVTTAPLPVNEQLVPDGCASCRRCLDGCPTGAIIAAGVVDAGRCLAWVLQKPGAIPRHLRAAVGDRIYGCDDCQEVCPPTVRFGPRHLAPSTVGADAPHLGGRLATAWLPVLRLLTADDDALMRLWGRWYLADREPRWIRRNALVVLGNVGDAADVEVQQVLAEYLAHDDPILRAHAVWAGRRLGLHHLMPTSDPHPDVQLELQASL